MDKKIFNLKRRGLGAIVLLTTALVMVAFLSLLILLNPLSPVNSKSKDKVQFVVPKGQAISIIGERLEEEGLIKNALVFRGIVKFYNMEEKIQSGSFVLSPSMTVRDIATELTRGSNDIWITVLEGWRREEIANYLSNQNLSLFDEDEFLALSSGSEGYLYPDTYLIPREYDAGQIFELLTNTFDQRVASNPEVLEALESSGRSFDDVMVMASLVEREARDYQQMRQVAGILWNRIDIGMALQVDATLQYIDGYSPTEESWWVPPRVSTKQTPSPYNTYQQPGLPPAPIANPSLEAVLATILPVESDNFYYLHTPDGRLYFSQTLQEHNANIERYLR